MPLVCPKCATKATVSDTRGSIRDGAYVIRRYVCVKGHKFTTREAPFLCIDMKRLRDYQQHIVKITRAERRRLYILSHPALTSKQIAFRLRISEERVDQVRNAHRRGLSRLSPPKVEDDS